LAGNKVMKSGGERFISAAVLGKEELGERAGWIFVQAFFDL